MCLCVCVYVCLQAAALHYKDLEILEEARHLLLWRSLEPTSRTRECSEFQGMDHLNIVEILHDITGSATVYLKIGHSCRG